MLQPSRIALAVAAALACGTALAAPTGTPGPAPSKPLSLDASDFKADDAANTTAPLIPAAPPNTASVPNVPLWLSACRGRNICGNRCTASSSGKPSGNR